MDICMHVNKIAVRAASSFTRNGQGPAEYRVACGGQLLWHVMHNSCRAQTRTCSAPALALLFRNFTSSSPAKGEVSGPGDSLDGDIDK